MAASLVAAAHRLYQRPGNAPAPLSREEEQIVFRKLEEHDEAAKETLTVHNLRLVVYIAKKI